MGNPLDMGGYLAMATYDDAMEAGVEFPCWRARLPMTPPSVPTPAEDDTNVMYAPAVRLATKGKVALRM